jgi:hypothetical protein
VAGLGLVRGVQDAVQTGFHFGSNPTHGERVALGILDSGFRRNDVVGPRHRKNRHPGESQGPGSLRFPFRLAGE